MKAMWLAFAATAVISVGAWYGLERVGLTAAGTTAGADVRLD